MWRMPYTYPRTRFTPMYQDLDLARRVFRYLAGAASVKLHMGGDVARHWIDLKSHTDSDYSADKSA